MLKKLFMNLIGERELFLELVLDHIKITLISVIIATIIGILVGIFISENKRIASSVISLVNIAYTIPAIALLGILISFTGIGNTSAVIALTIYALLPIVRSTYTGITNIDNTIIEASTAMGSTKFQILYKIKLPLALPIIFSAIRNMVTMTIALAGIASFIGAGGLGVAIYRGITTNNNILILSGSILIALLALIFDALLGMIERNLDYKNKGKNKSLKVISISIVSFAVVMFAIFSVNSNDKTLRLGSKPTTEGYILAEIVKHLVEEKSDLNVHVTHGVGGGTSNLHPATLKHDFDMYPEYTGTSWQIVLKENSPYANDMFDELKVKYEKEYNLTWKGMFGFNNTYGLAIQKDIAQKFNIKTYSDLAKYSADFTFGAEYDFFEREDGFKALTNFYNLKFKNVVDMDNGLKYKALIDKKIDVMTIFTTDGQLNNPEILVLEDNLKFYPSYMAGMVVRVDTLNSYPELNDTLKLLDNLIDEKTMAKLNFEVEIEGKKPEEVAKKFLVSKNLLEKSND